MWKGTGEKGGAVCHEVMEQDQREKVAVVDKARAAGQEEAWEGQEGAVWGAEALGQAANMYAHNVEQRRPMSEASLAWSRNARNADR
jgi:hypothetical protein